MLAELADDHRGTTTFYYLDVSFEESVGRHATRPQATEFGAEDMRGWYRANDLLGVPGERVVPQTSTLAGTTSRILDEVFGAAVVSPADSGEPAVHGLRDL
jgi:hypothetical protein